MSASGCWRRGMNPISERSRIFGSYICQAARAVDQMLQIALQRDDEAGRVVLDGSKVKANASKHKAMSYGRMQADEKRLQRR